MSDDGSVPRQDAIYVLKCNGAEVSPDGKTDMYLIVKGEMFEVVALPEICGRKLVRTLSRKFSTPIHHFYNPLMAPALPGEAVQ